MNLNSLTELRAVLRPLTFYQRFEHIVTLVLTALIALVVVAAVWNLIVRIVGSLILSNSFDPTDHVVFQSVFGAIFTVIIALEFKKSLLILTERQVSVVQVRAVIVIALLAIVRKLIILDVSETEALKLFALSAAILALGTVYWLIRRQDRRESRAAARLSATLGASGDASAVRP